MAKEIKITDAKFANLINFYIGYDAFQKYVEENSANNPGLKAHLAKGMALLRKEIRVMQAGIEKYLAPFAESINRQVLVSRALKANAIAQHLKLTIEFLTFILGRLSAQPAKMREIFEQRSFRVVNRAANALEEEDLSERIAICAVNNGVGRRPQALTWLRKSAEMVGKSLSEFELAVQDAETAQEMGAKVLEIDTQLAYTDPNSSTAKNLKRRKKKVIETVDQLAASSPVPEIVISSAVQAATTKKEHPNHLTRTGAKLGLNSEQENAMVDTGKLLIEAGAGSGKTRLLAGMVDYLINEKGVPSNQIVATSFSRKSAAEFKDRILAYGGSVVLDAGDSGIGTTHSISLKLLREFAPALTARGILGDKGGISQDALIRMAIEQVRMRPTFKREAPSPSSFFDGLVNSFPDGKEVAVSGEEVEQIEQEQKEESLFHQQYRKALETTLEMANWVGSNRGWSRWVRDAREAAEQLLQKQPEQLTPEEKKVFNVITGLSGKREGFLRNLKKGLARANLPMMEKLASHSKTARRASSRYWKEPANEWFNLGVRNLTDPGGNALSEKTAGTMISKYKGNLITPSQAWERAGTDYPEEMYAAAVYGAYEWLKANDLTVDGKIDFDDMLIEACKLLVGNKRARETLQERYKYIIVDEAQDQNPAQNLLFDLLAGYLDARTLQVYPDKRMTAKQYVFCGDSDQSIYAFRGATPEQFVQRSDLHGGDFKTHLLTMNYRSGKAIVDAANRLISHNENRIPKVCLANTEKNGMGVINYRSVENHDEGAEMAIEEIDSLKDEIGFIGSDGKPSFGIVTRTNAEAYAFVAECLMRELPFRSKINFFNDSTTKALIAWMNLANSSNSDDTTINQSVLTAHKSPGFLLDSFFEKRLQEIAANHPKTNYITILEKFWDSIYTGRSSWRNRNVREYLDTLKYVFEMRGSPTEIIYQILDLKGVGFSNKPALSMKESLIEELMKDEEAVARISQQSGGKPTSDDFEAEALAPLQVFFSVASKYEDLNPFISYVRDLQDINKKKHKKDDPSAEDYEDPAIVIDTAHGWKGLEAHHVYISMAGDTFPNTASKTSPEEMESERRLAYVAITRGQKSVVILSPKMGRNGKAIDQSQFIDEACISPLGEDTNTQELDEDRMEKTASQELFERILMDDSYEEFDDGFGDALEENWEFLAE